jgi:hypothetical protein
MACERLDACSVFLDFYRKFERGEIADHYLNHFCHHGNHLVCKRREHFLTNREQPADDLTPSGHRSLLIRFFK